MKQKMCPLIKAECMEHGCEFWHEMIVSKPDGTTSEWKCLYKWIPILLVENAKETRQAAASADKKATEFNMAAMKIIPVIAAAHTRALEHKS